MRIVFDLDGSLANCLHRMHYIECKPKREEFEEEDLSAGSSGSHQETEEPTEPAWYRGQVDDRVLEVIARIEKFNKEIAR